MEQLPLLWVSGAVVAGLVGSSYPLGFWKAFLAALILSFPIGIIITLSYKKKEKQNLQENEIFTTDVLNEDELETQSNIIVATELQQVK